MSTRLGGLFNFGRALPVPFDKSIKKISGVTSKYGSGTFATLCGNIIKAINAVCACAIGNGEGAVGINGEKCIAEYKSSVSPDAYHLVVYNSQNGNLLVAVYDKNTETMERYVLTPSARDGAAVIMAMFPKLMEDSEFHENYEKYYEQYKDGFSDLKQATNLMAVLCDDIYRRVIDDSCPAHIKAEIDASGNLPLLTSTHLDSGKYTPTKVIAGAFTVFASTTRATVIKKATPIIEHKDFIEKFKFHKRALTPLEQALIPKLPDWYVIPQEVIDVCKHAASSTGKSMPMRNFLLRGPAGTGKTMGAKAIAAGLGLPYVKYTCSAQTEIYDFIGQIFPETETFSTGDAGLDKEREQLQRMGGFTYANVSKLMNLPELEDMDYDPVGVYQSLTGVENAAATSQDCMAYVLDKVTEKIRLLSKPATPTLDKGQNFVYIETDFIKALKNGYVTEIQEPTCIMQPGVLVGLNSLLEQEGAITLPTGEIIHRHPDAIVVVTTNVSYEGCRGLNQSVVDRMSLIRDVELPAAEIMVQRAMSVTGETDEYRVSLMVQVINNMSDYCRKNSIADGTVGMRSLIDWIISSQITGDVYHSALYTVISKATTDEESREGLITTVLEPIFPPTRNKKTA